MKITVHDANGELAANQSYTLAIEGHGQRRIHTDENGVFTLEAKHKGDPIRITARTKEPDAWEEAQDGASISVPTRDKLKDTSYNRPAPSWDALADSFKNDVRPGTGRGSR